MSNQAPLRMTPSRRAILDQVRLAPTHPTADKVYREVRKELPRVSLGTVYRNLDTLARYGLIRVIDDAGGRKRYDGRLEVHCHVVCRVCGRIDDFHLDPTCHLEELLTEDCAFDIEGYRVNFVGVCPDCASSRTDPGASKGRSQQ